MVLLIGVQIAVQRCSSSYSLQEHFHLENLDIHEYIADISHRQITYNLSCLSGYRTSSALTLSVYMAQTFSVSMIYNANKEYKKTGKGKLVLDIFKMLQTIEVLLYYKDIKKYANNI